MNPETPDWSRIDFVVLDMDGTLLDLHFDDQVWNVLLPRRYGEKNALDETAAKTSISRHLDACRGTLPWYCLDHWTTTLDIEIGLLEEELQYLIDIRPGALDFLDGLAELGVKRILATNAHPRSLQRKLAITGIGKHFDVIVSAHTIGAAKEDAAFWTGLGERAGLDPARALLIDDNHAVLRTARAHGVAHLYGIARPDSRGETIGSTEFACLHSFSTLMPASGAERRYGDQA